jgi:phage FluMu protein Com
MEDKTHEIYMKYYGNNKSVKKEPTNTNRVFDEEKKTYFYHKCPRCGKDINGTTAELEEHIFVSGECVMNFKIVERIKERIPWWKREAPPTVSQDHAVPIDKPIEPKKPELTKAELDKVIDEAFE